MAARGSRKGPAAGHNDKQLSPEQENTLIKEMLDNITLHKKKQSAFKERMKLAWEQNVVSTAKKLRMPMSAVMAFFEDHAIETGTDENAVKKAEQKRARHLHTQNRLFAATHDGSQLDLVKLADIAKQADEEAEAAANMAEESEDE